MKKLMLLSLMAMAVSAQAFARVDASPEKCGPIIQAISTNVKNMHVASNEAPAPVTPPAATTGPKSDAAH